MKKRFLFIFLILIGILSGCGIKKASNVLGNMEKKLKDADSYYLEGEMEIFNNEDTYNYDVSVSYKKDDFYKIKLVNKLNNHEQVILRNEDGVYVITH